MRFGQITKIPANFEITKTTLEVLLAQHFAHVVSGANQNCEHHQIFFVLHPQTSLNVKNIPTLFLQFYISNITDRHLVGAVCYTLKS